MSRPFSRPSRRTTKVAAALTTPIAVLAAGALVYQASYAAFTGQTRNSGNEWSTGSISLTDDDQGSARFQVRNMLPGDTDSKCLTITANASVPSMVKGYAINPVTSVQGLESRIKMTVQSGTGGSFTDCTGFVPIPGEPVVPPQPLATLFDNNSFDKALGGWEVGTGTHTRTYKMTWTFDTAGMTQQQIDQLQGAKTGLDFQWEMRTQDRD